jgi:hypothetical protein
MAQQKGGKKLRRSPKHKGLYAAQVFRTARNKASAQTRIARRKQQKPQVEKRRHWRRKERRAGRAQPVVKHYYIGREVDKSNIE